MDIAVFLLVLSVVFSFHSGLVISVPHNNITDLSALLAFKTHIGDPHGVLASNWTSNTSFCSWTGVTCSRRRQRVTALRLDRLSLQGTILPNLANLSFLSYLSLGANNLIGPIPDALERLPRLSILVLDKNRLTGPIPPAIFNMSSLTQLSFYSNNLSGPLPLPANHTLALPRIQWISLSDNQLSGPIPSIFGQCRELQVLSLSFNQLSGIIPVELANLLQLRVLTLGANHLAGTIPASLGNCTKLRSLDFTENRLRGGIPSELGSLQNLQILHLAENSLSGPIPASLSNASRLRYLDLSHNNLTGQLPVAVGRMPALEYLNFEWNLLQGSLDDFIASVSNCRVLETLNLPQNELEGALPESIGNLSTHLLKFNAHSNYINGRIPESVGNLSSLIELNLDSNKLGEALPTSLTRSIWLQVLFLGDNVLQGSIPYELGRLKRLTMLNLEDNAITGPIPDSVGNISELQAIYLSGNTLSSGIPTSLWSLTGLLALELSHNSLEGSLPPEVGRLKNLDTVLLSANRLSGEIPSALGELQMLEYLDLSNNSLQGHIPESFGGLISINMMDLSSNALSGAIPLSLANLSNLARLNLSFNQLRGPVPRGGAFSNLTIQSLMGNTALCGAPRLGFPPCSSNSGVGRRQRELLKFILPAVASALVLIASFFLILLLQQRQRKRRRRMTQSNTTDTPHVNDCRFISYHELLRATENFSEANLLGRGSFGSVFKGILDDGLLVAIKVLNLEIQGASESFDAECRALRMARHRNLVKIITTCSNLDFKALVLEFMHNGSLENWLYSHNHCLSLHQRMSILLDVALALEYLHDHHVLHCDLKPSNILLDQGMVAHVSDFGIAKLLLTDSNSMVSASTPGTIGYVAPEYGSTGRVSRRGDIYSYGIVLLETFTRKKPTDVMFGGQSNLRQWVCEALPVAPTEVVDQNLLRDDYDDERSDMDSSAQLQCITSIIELGLLCSRNLPSERTRMKDVVTRLEKIRREYLTRLPRA